MCLCIMLKQVNFVVDVTDHPPQVSLLMQQHHIPPKVDLVLCQENESLNSEPVFRGARRSEPFVFRFQKSPTHSTLFCLVQQIPLPSSPNVDFVVSVTCIQEQVSLLWIIEHKGSLCWGRFPTPPPNNNKQTKSHC